MTAPTLYFHNPGELDIRGATIMGLHAKESESIGFFGTGLKYAIAVLLRNNHEIVIHSGTNSYAFAKQEIAFRGTTAEIITISENSGPPRELCFTTALGKTWELWQAYREIRSNAIDEGGLVSISPVKPMSGTTVIEISGAKILETHSKGGIFLEGQPDWTLPNLDVHRTNGANVAYYRGVRVTDLRTSAIFSYNIKDSLSLTEDRTVTWYFTVPNRIGCALVQSNDVQLLHKVLSCTANTFEADEIDYDHSDTEPSQVFLDVARALQEKGKLSNKSAIQIVKDNNTGRDMGFKESVLSPVEQKQLNRAIDILNAEGYPVDEYPIKTCERLMDNALGLADMTNDTIYLARAVYGQGTKQVAATLLEEWAHIRHGFYDETYRFQNWLFDRLLSTIEEKNGEPI